MMKDRKRSMVYGIVYWGVFTLTYFLLATICLQTRDPWSLSSTVWLPSGLLLGVLCALPPARWPLWVITASALHFSVSLIHDRPADIALTFAIIDPVIICPLAFVWNNLHNYARNLSHRAQTWLLLTGVNLGSILGGVFSDILLKKLGYPTSVTHFLTWGISNATGCLAITPLFIVNQLNKGRRQWLSYLQMFAAIMIIPICITPFFLQSHLFCNELVNNTLLYLLLILSLLLAAWLPLFPLCLYFVFLTMLASLATFYNYGPFPAMLNGTQTILASQIYLLVLISLGLLVSTREQHHRSKYQRLLRQKRLLSTFLQNRDPVSFYLTRETGEIDWLSHETVYGVLPSQLGNFDLLLAHIHPEERYKLLGWIKDDDGESSEHCCDIRMLLSDGDYHNLTICFSLYPSQDLLGMLVKKNHCNNSCF